MTEQKLAATPKPVKQTRLDRAIGQRVQRLVRTLWPYTAALACGGALALVLHTSVAFWVVLGAVTWQGVLLVHEESGWHRRGGRAAARARRKYQGMATRRELRRYLSLRAARKAAVITRPSLAGIAKKLPAAEAGVTIGSTAGRRSRLLAGSYEDCYAAFGPQRSGKTSGLLAGSLAGAPGAALGTSTRVDLWEHTVLARRERGPVHTLNPDGDGGIPTTFAWNPLAGCEYPATAIATAGYMMAAAPKDASGKDAWWDAQGAKLLRWMLHAAALAGFPITDVARWVSDPAASTEPLSILAEYPQAAPGWAGELTALLAHDEDEYLANVARSAAGALEWLADPAMAAVACPRTSWEGLDAGEFLDSGGTVYLIATARPHGSIAPYVATFTARLFDAARQRAARMPGARLDPPLTLVIDEPALTCPVPLPRWSAEAGGHGITLVTGFQSRSQLDDQWGEHGGRTFWNNATVKLIYGGFTDAADLEAISVACGETDTWDHHRGPDGSKSKSPRPQRLMPPERIRLLGQGTALVLHRRTRPVIAKITPVWDRPGYARAAPGHLPAPSAQPAVGQSEPAALDMPPVQNRPPAVPEKYRVMEVS